MISLVGASGYIGWELHKLLKANGEKVMGTYYQHKKPGLVRFDLETDNFSIFDKCGFVVILSAYTKIKFCEDKFADAFMLNVYHTMRLIDYLAEKDIPCLFMSSDAAEKNDTKYGKYKLLVELYIKKFPRVRYLRPGKVNDSNIKDLCIDIYEHIKRGISGINLCSGI